jgi:CRP-like cAMP-binding protein
MFQELTISLYNYLKKNSQLSDTEIADITGFFKTLKTNRNQILEQEGKVSKHFYFICKGCLRLYEIDSKGNEITGYFALEDSFITTLTSFILEKPSRDFLVSIEPSSLLVIERDKVFELIKKYHAFKEVYDKLIQFAFIHSQMRIYSFLGMEGIDKLKWVMEHEPKLLTRISSKAVASYLGMTNSTLSKLKAKL